VETAEANGALLVVFETLTLLTAGDSWSYTHISLGWPPTCYSHRSVSHSQQPPLLLNTSSSVLGRNTLLLQASTHSTITVSTLSSIPTSDVAWQCTEVQTALNIFADEVSWR
jgi:hypothetical protein